MATSDRPIRLDLDDTQDVEEEVEAVREQLRHTATVKDIPPAPGFEHASAPQPKRPDGQHDDHWVLPEEERKKGHIRPVRQKYRHLKCGSVTSMPLACAETYARDPKYYAQTFCYACGEYFPVGPDGQFVWDDDATKVGT